MKKIITLAALIMSLSSIAAYHQDNRVCGRLLKDFDTVSLITPRGLVELEADSLMAEIMLQRYHTGDSCCAVGDYYTDNIFIFEAIDMSIFPI